uniref:Uncharacterized protein n=1 Tax=Mola mola TaxID=94237 RepID=A0A3Q3W7Y7_MOLML
MCVSRCLQCVGLCLIPMAIVCMLANILLLLPDLDVHFLLDGHVTREATWATGLWGSGLLVCSMCHTARAFLQSSKTRGCCAFRGKVSCRTTTQVMYSCVGVLAAGSCCLVSFTGLSAGPLCLHNTTSVYLYNSATWSGVCLEPSGVVQWHVVLFSVMGGTSCLQMLLCGANIINSLLGMILGQSCCHNKV